jgi:hypothetical protein
MTRKALEEAIDYIFYSCRFFGSSLETAHLVCATIARELEKELDEG